MPCHAMPCHAPLPSGWEFCSALTIWMIAWQAAASPPTEIPRLNNRGVRRAILRVARGLGDLGPVHLGLALHGLWRVYTILCREQELLRVSPGWGACEWSEGVLPGTLCVLLCVPLTVGVAIYGAPMLWRATM